MQIDLLQRFFAASPAMHLLRSSNAPWILDFLNQQFKLSGKVVLLHSELAAALEAYLEENAPQVNRDRAETYLSTWCSASTGWLKRFIDDREPEPCYQLTADLELVLTFISSATREPAFIGTQSRLRAILNTLDHLAYGASRDSQSRIDKLLGQRADIDRELERLQSSPQVIEINPTEVREQFSLAAQQLSQLKSEFRAVEDRFKAIIRGVQQRILTADEPRGGILEFALDSEDLLKRGDQGKSFFEFLKLLHAPENQDRITRLLSQLHDIEALAGQHAELDALRTMVPTLVAEAEKILRTTQHLSTTLRRLLDSRSTRHHQQLAHLLRDIRSTASSLAHNPPVHIGLEVEVELEIQSPLDRPFWSRVDAFEQVELQPAPVDPAEQALALEQLAALERIDWPSLRRNVTLVTQAEGAIPIAELLARFPLRSGIVELLAYLQIAHDDGHTIDRSLTVEVMSVWQGSAARRLRLPNIVFLPDAARRKGHGRESRFQGEVVH